MSFILLKNKSIQKNNKIKNVKKHLELQLVSIVIHLLLQLHPPHPPPHATLSYPQPSHSDSVLKLPFSEAS